MYLFISHIPFILSYLILSYLNLLQISPPFSISSLLSSFHLFSFLNLPLTYPNLPILFLSYSALLCSSPMLSSPTPFFPSIPYSTLLMSSLRPPTSSTLLFSSSSYFLLTSPTLLFSPLLLPLSLTLLFSSFSYSSLPTRRSWTARQALLSIFLARYERSMYPCPGLPLRNY